MSIWWLLWLVLSIIILGASVWSQIILMKQKKAWQEFAKRRNLVFTKGTFAGPCAVEGSSEGFNISLFTATQQKEDSRKNRQVTTLQIIYAKPHFDAMAAGTKQMLPFLNMLNAISPHPIENKEWDSQSCHLYSRNKQAVEAYLNEERLKTLAAILKLGNSDNLVMITEEEGLYRFETSNPLTDPDFLEKLVVKLVANVKKMVPTAEEITQYKKLYSSTPTE